MKNNNYAFFTLATNIHYFKGAIELAKRLKFLKSQYNLLVLIPSKIYNDCLEQMTQINIDNIIIIKYSSFKKDECHNLKQDLSLTIDKFYGFKLIDYDKLIFLDADVFPLNNLDFYFNYEIPNNQPIVCFSHEQNNEIFTAGGIFIIKPSLEEYDKIENLITHPKRLLNDVIVMNDCLKYNVIRTNLQKDMVHYAGDVKYWEAEDYDINLLNNKTNEEIINYFASFIIKQYGFIDKRFFNYQQKGMIKNNE